MKKIYSLGVLSVLSTPLVTLISCANTTDSVSAQSLYKNYNIKIDVRIPDWSKEVSYDGAVFNDKDYIEEWHYVRRQPVHNMVPYSVDRQFVLEQTNALTLGGILDELNLESEIFKFNLPLEEAGNMGRFLSGIKKSDDVIAKEGITNLEHEGYWGIYFADNGHNMIIQTNDSNYSYISLSSPNNVMAQRESHLTFDRNESFYFFDGRLPRGVDGVNVSSNDIFYLNLWRMM